MYRSEYPSPGSRPERVYQAESKRHQTNESSAKRTCLLGCVRRRAEVLYAEKESDLGGLQIGLCNNPPYDLDHYIKYPHIYWLEGNFDERWMNQFLDYAKTQLPANQQVEVWSIWFGEGFQEISHKHLSVTKMTKEDLRWFRTMNICIHLDE